MALGDDIKKLGFGLMRLPVLEGGEIDIPQLCDMADLFLERGFTYFDTAYGYHGGKSETAIGEALVARHPRDSYTLATKLPAWAGAKTADEAKQMFYTSLERTGAGYFDFYLLHNLGGNRTDSFDRFGIWDFVQEKKREGKIRHVGFSFHDKPELLDEILKKHPEVEFVQLQINYADWEDPMIESRRCYEVARSHGKPIVVMEPVKGGQLTDLPADAARLLRAADPSASLASWAIRYAASLPGILTVLSGMSNLAQVEDNTAYMRDMRLMRPAEKAVVAQVQKILSSIPRIPCTACRYCTKGCPMQINIPDIFKAANMVSVFGNRAGAKGSYGFATRGGGKACDCVGCGQCESVCPQHISVIEELKKWSAEFDA